MFRLIAIVALFSRDIPVHSHELLVLQLLNVHVTSFLDGQASPEAAIPLCRPPMYPPSPLAPILTQDLLGLRVLGFSPWLVVFGVLGFSL